jgi:hypothetical protein
MAVSADHRRDVRHRLGDVLVPSELDRGQQADWIVLDFEPLAYQRTRALLGDPEAHQDGLADPEELRFGAFTDNLDIVRSRVSG